MTIGIIGAGLIGTAFARRAAHSNVSAILSNSRGPETLASVVQQIGGSVRAGTREEAAAQEIVFLAVNWSNIPSALASLPDFGGRIVIDASNPIEPPTFQPADLHGRLSTEVLADYLPGARVVKAFNHLPAKILAEDPSVHSGRRVLFYAGADVKAKAEIASLIDTLGFFGVDLGGVNDGGRAIAVPGGNLVTLNLVRFG